MSLNDLNLAIHSVLSTIHLLFVLVTTGCPAHHYCPALSTEPSRCPDHHYCPANSSRPISCENSTGDPTVQSGSCQRCTGPRPSDCLDATCSDGYHEYKDGKCKELDKTDSGVLIVVLGVSVVVLIFVVLLFYWREKEQKSELEKQTQEREKMEGEYHKIKTK